MTVTCTKARSVCHLLVADSICAEYATEPDDESDEQPRMVRIPHDLYVDLGRPSTITVTIRPGDHLNMET